MARTFRRDSDRDVEIIDDEYSPVRPRRSFGRRNTYSPPPPPPRDRGIYPKADEPITISRRRHYFRPYSSESGKPLAFNIKLHPIHRRGSSSEQGTEEESTSKVNQERLPRFEKAKKIDVLSSRRYKDDQGRVTASLYVRENANNDQPRHFRWM